MMHCVTRRSVDRIRVVHLRELCGRASQQQRYPDMERMLPNAEESRQSGRARDDLTRESRLLLLLLPAAFSAFWALVRTSDNGR